MSETALGGRLRVLSPEGASPCERRWGWPHYLALLGAPILVWNVWTVAAWLADGPQQVTQFRDTSSANWYVAHGIEVACVVASLFVIRYLIRGCRAEGRVLTFDVMFCIAGATIFWSDYVMNFFQPVFLASSNFINVNNTCGHQPFVVNPDCGRAPDPIVFFFLVETFLLLPLAIGAGKLARRLQRRSADTSMTRLAFLVVGVCMVACLAEIGVVALGVWSYHGSLGIPIGHGGVWSPIIWLQTSAFFAGVSLLYLMRNDKGERLVERGLDGVAPRRRTGITLLALYAGVQFMSWVPGGMPVMAQSFFQKPWKEVPPYLLNDVCDTGATQGTRYGPCPGSPGFEMPIRSQPGEKLK